MANSKINWKRSDYARLGRAVSDFNKKISELNAEEKKLYLPEKISYQEAKENIMTRNELNRLINSLRRFQREGAEDLYITQAGQQMSKWERRELGIMSRTAQNKLAREMKEYETPTESGFTKAQMGSSRYRELARQKENLRGIELTTGYEFQMLRDRVLRRGASDYTWKKATVYKENYLKEMEKYSHFDNYDKLMKKLNSFSNPVSFYNFVSQNELTADLTYQSDEYYTQEAFNSFVESLGIKLETDSQTLDIEGMKRVREMYYEDKE